MKVSRRNLMKSGIAGVLALFGLDRLFVEEKVENVFPDGYRGDQFFAAGFIYFPYVPLFIQDCRSRK